MNTSAAQTLHIKLWSNYVVVISNNSCLIKKHLSVEFIKNIHLAFRKLQKMLFVTGRYRLYFQLINMGKQNNNETTN